MWNREEAQKNQSPNDVSKANAGIQPVQPAPIPSSSSARAVASMGASLVIKGELTGAEDLVIDGRVEGKVSLPGHLLTIGPQAKVHAEVIAKAVIIQGSVTGNVTASDRFEIRGGGSMTGDLTSPKVIMAEGSEFRGRVDMKRVNESKADKESKKEISQPVAV
ncbi:MAG TPA: polymer-forming cytoskeletal protein [Vicinamibacterales bacterium]|jgi:cytoskeletal protein CcmA (bactofilin family)